MAVALLAVGAAALPAGLAAQSQSISASVQCDAEANAEAISIGGETMTDLRSATTIARLHALAQRNPFVILTNKADTPYRCFGGAVFVLQRAGFRKVGFISEPPPGY